MRKKIFLPMIMLMLVLIVSVCVSSVCFAEESTYKTGVTDGSNVLRQDAENRMRDIVYKIDALDINLYDDSPAIQHMLEVFRVSADELDNLSNWTDAVLIERLNILEDTYNSLEKRGDKEVLAELVKKARTHDYENYGTKFNDRQQAKLDKLLLECDSALANTISNNDNIIDLTKRVTNFLKPYAPYPWWSWLIIAILSVGAIAGIGIFIWTDECDEIWGFVTTGIANILLVVMAVLLCYCTILLWWHTFLIFIGGAIVLDIASIALAKALSNL